MGTMIHTHVVSLHIFEEIIVLARGQPFTGKARRIS
jgi:hypothetical protein